MTIDTTALALPDDFANQIAAGIAESRSTTVLGSGKPFLRLLKSGIWVFGQENIEVQEGSSWIINTLTVAHGWCCWVETSTKNELKGEVMDSVTRRKPACPDPISGQPYVEQRSFELKCLDGDDAGTEVLYKTTSDGGMKAADAVFVAIQQQAMQKGNQHLFPVVQFGQTSYKHSKYGEIFKPIFTVRGWADIKGELKDAKAAPAAAAPEPAPARPRRPPVNQPAANPAVQAAADRAAQRAAGAAMVAEAAAPAAEPLSTQQARVGQRRRPAR